MWRKRFRLALLAGGLLVMACGRGPAKTPPPTPTGTITPTAAASPTATPAPALDPQAEVKAYLAKVFPPGPGRQETFEQCTTCHGIHVIVIAGPVKDEANWGNTRFFHETFTLRPGSKEVDDLIFKYLFEHFNESLPPPPPLPDLLMTGWQNYL